MKNTLFVHVQPKVVLCTFVEPLSGYYPEDFKQNTYSHPEVKILINRQMGCNGRWSVVDHAVMTALQGQNIAVHTLERVKAKKTKKVKEVSKKQLPLW